MCHCIALLSSPFSPLLDLPFFTLITFTGTWGGGLAQGHGGLGGGGLAQGHRGVKAKGIITPK